ncbi:MAG: hypothetical protein ACREPM_18825, partial [Gemmatimonadaceae bacterium]
WYRMAGWSALASCYGAWALCAKRIDEAESDGPAAAWLRASRSLTKGAGLGLGVVLSVDVLVRVLGFFFHCPGCAG